MLSVRLCVDCLLVDQYFMRLEMPAKSFNATDLNDTHDMDRNHDNGVGKYLSFLKNTA